jgi:methylated-DNA-[protein]-cysteine S-methyltransferase
MIPLKAAQLFFCIRSTPFGPVAVLWADANGEPGIYRIIISTPLITAINSVEKLFPGALADSNSEINLFCDQMDAFLNGEDIQFSLDKLRLDLCAPFQKKALLADYAIPRGRVGTYGLIAMRMNNPNAARAVGTAMADNPFPIVIPCHRIIRSDSSLGGYGGGSEMKRRLLEMEGVEFRDENHVAESCFY